MYETRLFLILGAVCIAVTALTVPRQARALRREGIAVGSAFTLGAIQLLVLAALAAAVGAHLAPKVGLSAPFWEAVVGPAAIVPALKRQVVVAILLGGVAATGSLMLYYWFFRPRLDVHDVLRMERVRLRMGVVARVLHGGIVEEVVFRWGVMTGIAWLVGLILGWESPAVMWVALVASGVIFGLAHLGGARMLGMQRTWSLLGTAVVVNLWVGAICGWLYWQYGLLAAMLAHALVHAIWVVFDGWSYRRLAVRSQVSAA